MSATTPRRWAFSLGAGICGVVALLACAPAAAPSSVAAPPPAAAPPAAQPSAAAGPAGQQPGRLRPVSLRLDWLFQGPNAGFVVAKDKGYYEQAGLDVTIGAGQGSGSTAQVIANKADQVGFSDGYVVANSVANDMNIKMVGAIYRRNPTAAVVLADSGISGPRDLDGKTMGIPTGGAGFQQWPAYMKGCGLDASRTEVVNLDPAAAPAALMQRRVDGIAGFAQGFVPSIEIKGGQKAQILWFADCGVDVVSNGIIVHNDLLRENPDLVRDFVAASVKGFLYTRQKPDEAVESVQKFSPTIEPAVARRELELSWQTWVTPNTADQPLGWMSDKDWQATVKILRQYGGVSASLDPQQVYTNDFVPAGAEFVPPARS